MSRTGSEFFIDALESYDVSYLFGNPGTTELPLMDALSDSDIEYVLGLHEDVAVGMASGYAKTRQWHRLADPDINPIGVVNLHVAPGLAHGLGNVFDSSLIGTCAPLLVTAGVHSTGHQHRDPNLYGDLVTMADQFTKWSGEVKSIDAFPNMLRRAVHTALTPPTGPVFLALPFDVMRAEIAEAPQRLGRIPTPGQGDPAAIERAAGLLAGAEEPVMVVGDRLPRSGPGAVETAVDLAERVGARVHGEFRLSEAAFPTAHPQWAGGLPNDRERSTALLSGDVVLSIGTISNVPTLEQNRPILDYDGITTVDVSDHAREIGKNYVADVGVFGSIDDSLEALLGAVDGRIGDDEREARLAAVQPHRAEWEATVDSRPQSVAAVGEDAGMTNAELADAICETVPDARIVAEATTSVGALRDRGNFGPGEFFNYRGGGLGYGLSAAIGIGVAEAEASASGATDAGAGESRPVIGFIGDGSFLYYPNAIYSAVRSSIDVTLVIANNMNYQVLKDKLPGLTGRPPADHDYIGMELEPPLDIPGFARAQGADATRVADRGAFEAALLEATESAGPTVIDVRIVE